MFPLAEALGVSTSISELFEDDEEEETEDSRGVVHGVCWGIVLLEGV